jgi:N6-adenosine-specific RNA methylase IME4
MHININTSADRTSGSAPSLAARQPLTDDEANRLRRFGTTKKIKVWHADPPWNIAQTGKRGAIQHYELMTLERIKAMGPLIQEMSDVDATLLMWVTNATLPAGIEVLRSWGFEYKSHGIWDKYHMGLGNYFRSSHETLLHGVRGKAPFKFHGQKSLFAFPRTEHSRKPDEMIPLIERLLDGPYAELFARRRPNSRSDWSVWGNEIDSDFKLPGFPVPSDRKFEAATAATTGGSGDA